VALLVLAHQTQMHNLITLTNYQTRLTLHALGKDEGTPAYAQATLASLPEDAREKITKPRNSCCAICSSQARHRWVGRMAPSCWPVRPSRAVSRRRACAIPIALAARLRPVDAHLPPPLQLPHLFQRLRRHPRARQGLHLSPPARGADRAGPVPDFAHLSTDERAAILSILLETKPGLPAEWRAYAQAHKLRVATRPPHSRPDFS
jgi:hypothetical protein